MEVSPIAYKTFSITFIQRYPSMNSILRLTREFTKRSLRSKLVMVFIIFNLMFVVAFPTIAGAMTGYSTNAKAYIPDPTGNLIAYSDFVPVIFMIHDAERINLTADYAVAASNDAIPRFSINEDPYISLSYDVLYMSEPYGNLVNLGYARGLEYEVLSCGYSWMRARTSLRV